MPNGRYFLNDMEFEQHIKKLSDRQLLEFTSRQTYDISILARHNEKRISALEGQSNRRTGIIGGGGAIIGAAVVAVIDYFR
ncbi:unnamed protein product, partial [marine sediment metagenome]